MLKIQLSYSSAIIRKMKNEFKKYLNFFYIILVIEYTNLDLKIHGSFVNKQNKLDSDDVLINLAKELYFKFLLFVDVITIVIFVYKTAKEMQNIFLTIAFLVFYLQLRILLIQQFDIQSCEITHVALWRTFLTFVLCFVYFTVEYRFKENTVEIL